MNQAMLAKAAWRILQDDKGLWCQMLKLKYLANSTFPQNYKKPAACSNIWSSINYGMHLMLKGLKWRIGNGSSVNFWTDNWTDYGPLAAHAINHSQIIPTAKVCEFWIHKCWDSLKLAEHLPPGIVDHICAIPISYSEANDKLIWGVSSSGNFSVKSAYLLKFTENQPPVYPWAQNWKLPIPPKLKIFLWTIVARKLLTNEQRVHRSFTMDPSCFHCPGNSESLLHLFRDCPKAMMVWNSFYIPPSMIASFHLDWNGWLHSNLMQHRCLGMSTPWNILFIFICWHIWKWRCKCVFDCQFNLPFNMSSIILSYVKDWAAATRKTQSYQNKQIIKLHWIKPPTGVLKVNVDGSLNCHGHIGAGGVMRDCNGTWYGGFMANLGAGDILQAEAWGMLYGLQLALNHGVQQIEIESDSAILVKLLNDEASPMHPLDTIITNCKSTAANFLSCSICHIHRERNTVADLLAKASLDYAKGVVWLNAAPTIVSGALQDDNAGSMKTRRVPTHAPLCSSSHADANPHWHHDDANDATLMHSYSDGRLNTELSPPSPHATNANDNRMDAHPTYDFEEWPGLHSHGRLPADNDGNLHVHNGPVENDGLNIQPSAYG